MKELLGKNIADEINVASAHGPRTTTGGGSSTIAVRDPAASAVTVRNVPSDGIERPVANGVGVFVH